MDEDVPRPWGVVAGGTVRVKCGMMFYTSSLERDANGTIFSFGLLAGFVISAARRSPDNRLLPRQ
jgi:hypothetical protein